MLYIIISNGKTLQMCLVLNIILRVFHYLPYISSEDFFCVFNVSSVMDILIHFETYYIFVLCSRFNKKYMIYNKIDCDS